MASTSTSTGRSTSSNRRRSSRRENGAQDALQLLRADHKNVQDLFDQFEKARADDRKSELAKTICNELKVHTQIEEEIFYPAAREALRDADPLNEATVEHDTAKQLIEQIESTHPGDETFAAKVKVLGEYVRHHIKEEQNQLFPQLRKTDLDLKELGNQLAQRKAALNGGMEEVSPSS